MTTYGETPTGFRRKTHADIVAHIKERMRGRIDSRLALDSLDWVGNTIDSVSDEIALCWEVLEACRNAFDPDGAEGSLMIALAALTGTQQLGATNGLVPVNLGLEANKTFAIGELVASVKGDPTNRWVNSEVVESSNAATYPAVFKSETPGSQVALSGTLTVIAQTKTGWLNVTNTADASPGREVEDVDDLRARREENLATQGSSSVTGIHADVTAADEAAIQKVLILANDSDQWVDGMPPHSIRAIIWDGVTQDGDNNVIAQAVFDSKSAAARTVGTESGIAKDPLGNDKTVLFDRSTQVPMYLSYAVDAETGTDVPGLETAIKLAAIAAMPDAIGGRVIAVSMQCVPLEVDGVIDVTGFALGKSANPTASANVVAAFDETLVLDSSNISVTVNVQ